MDQRREREAKDVVDGGGYIATPRLYVQLKSQDMDPKKM